MKRISLIILLLVSVLHISHAETGEVQMSGLNVKALDSIAVSFYENQDYDQAELYFSEELTRLKDSLKTDIDSTCSKVYTYLGWIYTEKGKYYQAYEATTLALEIKLHVYGDHHPEYAISMAALGYVFIATGDDYQAEPYLLEALQIYSDSMGQNNVFSSNMLQNLGLVYLNMGDYRTAEKNLLQSIQISKDVEGDTSSEYAAKLHALGLLYYRIGDYEGALNYFVQAYKIWIESGVGSKEVAISCSSIGRICTDIGEYELADQFLSTAIYLQDSLYNGQSLEYARTLSNAANYFRQRADYENALDYYLAAMEMRKSIVGQQHLGYALSLNDIGVVLFKMGRYDLAEEYYLSAYLIYKDMSSSYDNSRLTSLFNLGHLYYIQGRYAESEVHFSELCSLYKTLYVKSVDFMSARQRQEYWNTMLDLFENWCPDLTFRYVALSPSITTLSYNNELFKKGLLLTSSDAVKRSILESSDTTLIHQWNDLTKKKQQIMVLEEKNSDADYLAQLREEAETLEKEITRSSAAYRENMRQWEITWDSVRAVLKPKQVAIEFMRAPLNEDSTMYCALLVRDTCSYPIMIPLFEEKEVTQLLQVSIPSSINKAYSYRENGKELSRLVWSKVLPYINPGEIVFFAPTGLLHEVAMESIPYDSTQVISDVYNLVRLSSTRELAIHKPAISHKKATLYGGISYDVSADELLAQSAAYPSLTSRSVINDTINRGRVRYLPGTKSEIEGIQKALSNKEIRVQAYTASAANEESFKALSGTKQNILHVATHGFYWPDSTNIDPMERSGLLLAGANIVLSGHRERLPEGIEDGVLTAKEISTLDLREADIVVLSACETAQGVITGEGVFGLQRAFKMAGAQTLLMAIWPVSDEATQLLMNFFYRYYSQGMSKRQAFRMAQQEVRSYTAEGTSSGSRSSLHEKYKNKGKMTGQAPQPPKGGVESSVVSEQGVEVSHPYASPYYWAGFILLD